MYGMYVHIKAVTYK